MDDQTHWSSLMELAGAYVSKSREAFEQAEAVRAIMDEKRSTRVRRARTLTTLCLVEEVT